MPRIPGKTHKVHVAPNLPAALDPLHEIARNLWFCWNWEAVELFIRLDSAEWEASKQNPVALLGRLPQSRLEEMARDESYLALVDRVHRDLQTYLKEPSWYARQHPDAADALVAYFSCEYGIDQGLPIYSGGLGILSGDHLKTASDLGVPLVGVGLLYRQGYFQQELSADGWQREQYPENDWHTMPVEVVTREDGRPLQFQQSIGGRDVTVQVWRAHVGRTTLYLLDVNLPENAPADRTITMQLYGGDREMRLRQEILLGMGGCRALAELGHRPTVYHCNEGHSAFCVLERLRQLLEAGLSLPDAREVVWATTVFTTHTPVPAGNERFEAGLLERYLAPAVHALGWSWDEFVALGREDVTDSREHFCMTVFALRFAAFCNGVSALHGTTSRNMWQNLWPRLPARELPIAHVTNGVHLLSWLSHDMAELLTRYFGPRFALEPWREDLWDRISRIPDAELWRVHERRRERVVFFARKRMRAELARRGAGEAMLATADQLLDPDVLTIGFARRFAQYKRGTLLFSDPERLRRLVTDLERPIQFLFAGKAHPQDTPGKELIKELVHYSRQAGFENRVVFMENYDINVARYLVQGVDVWLNVPRRPLEASGTSGMKAAANGGLQLSTLDGWWCEGYRPDLGWAIGAGEEYADPAEADQVEGGALYTLLEQEVIPMFYARDRAGLPREWIARMKESMRSLAPQFSSHRMLMEYAGGLYDPAHALYQRLGADNYGRARALAEWRRHTGAEWGRVTVTGLTLQDGGAELRTGDGLIVEVSVDPGTLHAGDIVTEVVFGRIDAQDEFVDPDVVTATLVREPADGAPALYRAECVCEWSGRYGFAARVRADHPDLAHGYQAGLLTWERE